MNKYFLWSLLVSCLLISNIAYSGNPKVEPVGDTVITEKRTFTFYLAECLSRLVFEPRKQVGDNQYQSASVSCNVEFPEVKKSDYEIEYILFSFIAGYNTTESLKELYKVLASTGYSATGYRVSLSDYSYPGRESFTLEEAKKIITDLVTKSHSDGKQLSLLVQYPKLTSDNK